MLFSADGITSAQKIILRAYLNTTANIAGCQAIRKKIGHCCFGFRVVHGEVIFVTVSPNRRHSSMILKLSRCRANDVSLERSDSVAAYRKRHCGPNTPKIFASKSIADDPSGEEATVEIPMPDIFDRQGCNAQDPLSSCHHYLFFMHVILPGIFGIRMCLSCPDCNVDHSEPLSKYVACPCSDYMGSNKAMGGYAGLATGLCFATEYQGEATPHGHGFLALANMYQHCTLEEIGRIIEEKHRGLTKEDMLQRVLHFIEHLQREDHFDDADHQKNFGNIGTRIP